MDKFSNNPHYIVNGDTSGNITGPWVKLERDSSLGFQINIAGSAPNGTHVFETTNDEDPNVNVAVLGAATLTLPAAMVAMQPAGASRNDLWGFNPCPEAKWMRWRYVRNSGGQASGINIGLCQRGL